MKNYLLLPAALLLAACGQSEEAPAPATEPAGEPEAAAETAPPEPAAEPAPASLEEILAAQPATSTAIRRRRWRSSASNRA